MRKPRRSSGRTLQGPVRRRNVRKCTDSSGPDPMTLAPADADLSIELSRAIAARVREELARRRLSRQALADLAKISISTLEKALAGRRPFTLATTIRLEEALGATLRAPVRAAASVSPTGLAPET